MELTQLKYFLAVAESGSFIQAAEKCFVSQSALSAQVQKLENEFGKQLLNRGHGRVVPTDAGKILIWRGKRILAQAEKSRLDIQSLDSLGGRIAIGILPTIAPYFLSRVLKSFAHECPKTYVTVHEDTMSQLLQNLERNKLDIGIITLPLKEHGFETEKLFSEELVLALPTHHALVEKPRITVKDLYSERFILVQEGHCLGDQSLDFCHKRDFHPCVTIQCGRLITLLSFVAVGLGISLVPQMATVFAPPQIIYRRLEEPRPKRTIAIVTRSKRPLKRAALAFLKHLRRTAGLFDHGYDPNAIEPEAVSN